MKNTLKVVAAIIKNEKDEILCALRSPSMSLPNLWEFPGGKVEKDEKLEEAIIREIKEELNCDIEVFNQFDDVTHEYERVIVNLITFICKIKSGTPIAKEHSQLIWTGTKDLNKLEWAPADVPTVNKLIKEM